MLTRNDFIRSMIVLGLGYPLPIDINKQLNPKQFPVLVLHSNPYSKIELSGSMERFKVSEVPGTVEEVIDYIISFLDDSSELLTGNNSENDNIRLTFNLPGVVGDLTIEITKSISRNSNVISNIKVTNNTEVVGYNFTNQADKNLFFDYLRFFKFKKIEIRDLSFTQEVSGLSRFGNHEVGILNNVIIVPNDFDYSKTGEVTAALYRVKCRVVYVFSEELSGYIPVQTIEMECSLKNGLKDFKVGLSESYGNLDKEAIAEGEFFFYLALFKTLNDVTSQESIFSIYSQREILLIWDYVRDVYSNLAQRARISEH